MRAPVIFVNRRSDSNVGDQFASPHRYFGRDYSLSIPIEIHLPDGAGQGRFRRRLSTEQRRLLQKLRDRASAIIIGGGGLLGNDYFEEDVAFWSRGHKDAPSKTPAILWGAGHNNHDILAVSQIVPDAADYGQLVPFSLIGLRDWGPGFTWVPCASCMHPLLDAPAEEGRGTLFALHRDTRELSHEHSAMLTDAPDDLVIAYNDERPEILFGKLRNAKQVVTNSFHLAYWATLLKKPVVAIGGGTKVRLLKHKVAVGTPLTWRDAMKDADRHETALEECRDRNVKFNKMARDHIGSGLFGRRPTEPNPVQARAAEALITGKVLTASKRVVPRIVHFIFGLSPDFGGKPFNIMHYIAVKSVARKFKPDKIYFHYHYEPDNEYYNKIRHLIEPIKVEIPTEIYGNTLSHFAHKADVIRLRTLLDSGGLYLDLDTITVNSFDPILDYSFTIGTQGQRPVEGLCNAVMAAAPNDPFVRDWLERYREFSDSVWDKFSVNLPYLMWRSGDYAINVEPYARFHWPLWQPDALKKMFEENHEFPSALCHHLWESVSFPKYFRHEPFEAAAQRLREGTSTYARLARPYLE